MHKWGQSPVSCIAGEPVQRFARVLYKKHSSIFPVSMMRYLIDISTERLLGVTFLSSDRMSITVIRPSCSAIASRTVFSISKIKASSPFENWSSSIRVPTQNVSVVDLVFTPGRDATVDEINGAMVEAANGPLKGVLGVTDKPLVSSDFNHDPHSSTFALKQTQILEGKLVRVLSWYDNEWGFATRMTDTALEMAKHM